MADHLADLHPLLLRGLRTGLVPSCAEIAEETQGRAATLQQTADSVPQVDQATLEQIQQQAQTNNQGVQIEGFKFLGLLHQDDGKLMKAPFAIGDEHRDDAAATAVMQSPVTKAQAERLEELI